MGINKTLMTTSKLPLLQQECVELVAESRTFSLPAAGMVPFGDPVDASSSHNPDRKYAMGGDVLEEPRIVVMISFFTTCSLGKMSGLDLEKSRRALYEGIVKAWGLGTQDKPLSVTVPTMTYLPRLSIMRPEATAIPSAAHHVFNAPPDFLQIDVLRVSYNPIRVEFSKHIDERWRKR
ncbi:hypothetical protein FOPE_09097 [Fonsecaea pedrosoi]|nr:hypothetical protein FOPE_09097 [Fonsecaea pedrosoi]